MYINLEILHKLYSESVVCFEMHARCMCTVQQDWLCSGRYKITEQGVARTTVISQVSYYRSVLNL